ncbi:MAG: hypothetical protein EOO42_02540 [Flavobacteriales bacterium]|nr:MAG: hypothetical protein EOO42_02540 [Flavobacteriales bacterium]
MDQFNFISNQLSVPMVWVNKSGIIVDFTAGFLKFFKLEPTNFVNSALVDYLPELGNANIFSDVNKTAQFNTDFQSLSLNRRIRAVVHQATQPICISFFDIDDLKGEPTDKNEKVLTEVEKTKHLLQATLDSSPNMIQVFKAVRDQKGEIIDFIWLLNNKTSENIYGEIIGKRLLVHNPGVQETGIFEHFKTVIKTGVAMQYEKHYIHEQFNGWFYQSVVKLGDGVVTTTADFTKRKTAEEERLKHYVLLSQSEKLAGTGSWEYNVETGALIASEGFYRIFELDQKTKLTLQLFLSFATADCKDGAQRLVEFMQKGEGKLELTLDVMATNGAKNLHLQVDTLKGTNNDRLRVLGVMMDVTESRSNETRMKAMQIAQQQDLLKVSLAAQEEERRRISESLHNGLGQLLFGTKLNLETLTTQLAKENSSKFNQTKNYTTGLLAQAIRDTRSISHQLMPTVLAEFGLSAAITDVCLQLQEKVHFDCHINLKHQHLENYLELAIFRTVQELALNVVKHAKATHAIIKIEVEEVGVLLNVRDNGIGMTKGILADGIGLKSIMDKVALLKGNFDVNSCSDGTEIEVFFPLVISL